MIADPMACDITSIFEKEWKWDEFYTRCECQSFNTKAKLFLPHAHVPHAHAPHAYAQDAHAPHAHIHCILCLAFISFDSIRALRLPLGSIQGDSTSQVLSGFIKFSLPFTLFQKIWKTEVNIKLQSMFLGTFVFLALFFFKIQKGVNELDQLRKFLILGLVLWEIRFSEYVFRFLWFLWWIG